MKSKVFTKVEANDFIKKVETELNGLHRTFLWQGKQGNRELADNLKKRLDNIIYTLEKFGLKFSYTLEKECATCDSFICYHFVEYEGYKGEEK